MGTPDRRQPKREQTGAQTVLRMLREIERRARDLSRREEGFEPVTETRDFPDGELVVTISAESGPVTVAFYSPDLDETVVMSLEQLRQRVEAL